jgi:hypothetical protein
MEWFSSKVLGMDWVKKLLALVFALALVFTLALALLVDPTEAPLLFMVLFCPKWMVVGMLALLFPNAALLMSQVLFVMVLKEPLDLCPNALRFGVTDPCDWWRIADIGLEEGEGRFILGLGFGLGEELKNDEALGVPCALLLIALVVA